MFVQQCAAGSTSCYPMPMMRFGNDRKVIMPNFQFEVNKASLAAANTLLLCEGGCRIDAVLHAQFAAAFDRKTTRLCVVVQDEKAEALHQFRAAPNRATGLKCSWLIWNATEDTGKKTAGDVYTNTSSGFSITPVNKVSVVKGWCSYRLDSVLDSQV